MPPTRSSLAAFALALPFAVLPFTVLSLALLSLAVLPAAPAAAAPAVHGGSVHLLVANSGGGQPRTVPTWERDGDPVTEPLRGTLSADSLDGRHAGPWRLLVCADGSYRTAESLAPGHWHLTVEAAAPALGRGEADLVVAAAATDTRTPTARPPYTLAPDAPALAEPARPRSTGLRVLAAGAALGAAGLLLLRLGRGRGPGRDS
ncbi:hypothetical protein CFP65_2614 [Kitasatospora sp. MMS16-BH015]|uniref:hypothetical protein n=1 Tax=Kitasatospora sp. MMS16-BH015 TaxID=2018025 RepID=UPI000CA0DCB1|nr:hypothetical protein [Kitasatospora sp. MMS16-BH015]AUG77439.1 hypothetical protein CFP65_2614 [Kitasatospora sp. MMS16-BH015]